MTHTRDCPFETHGGVCGCGAVPVEAWSVQPDDRAVRMALEFAALTAAVRRYVAERGHQDGGCAEDPCALCEALAVVDRSRSAA